jgi:hypothetical protein
MQNDPTGTSGSGRCSTYFDAIRRAEEDISEALGHVRAEEDAGRITTAEAATERIELLERHLKRCRRLRAEHLGSTP